MTDDVARALLMSELPIPGTPMRPASGPSVDEVFTNVGQRLNRKLEGYLDGVARALSAPATAMQGGYNYIEINPDGSINQIPTAMLDDAAGLAGLASVGSMPVPRPTGSLGAGGRETIDQLLAQARQRISSREAMVDEIVASGRKSVKMTGKAGAALVGPDMSKSGGYRVTYFDPMGVPNGHVETSTYADAIKRALMDGFSVQQVQ